VVIQARVAGCAVQSCRADVITRVTDSQEELPIPNLKRSTHLSLILVPELSVISCSAIMAGMWCLTEGESQAWCEGHGLRMVEARRPMINNRAHDVTVSVAEIKWYKVNWLSGFLASYLEPYHECLLWVTTWGVWSSSENWHLFYRLRESYGERRQLRDAPGHIYLNHERTDLTTFVELGLLFGWDFYLLTSPNYHTAFVSHDEFIEFHTDDGQAAESARRCLDESPESPVAQHG
jgi:hypothetical protein